MRRVVRGLLLVAVVCGGSATPAAAELVYTVPGGCGPSGCQQDVWRAGDDGSSQRRILTNAGSPAFDLLGTKVAYVRDGAIGVAKPDGSEAKQLTTRGANGGYDTNPVFSPSGSLIAFDSNRPDGGSCRRIWLVDAAGGSDPRPMPGSECGDRLPQFTPDGLRVMALRYDQFGMGSPSLVSTLVAGGPSIEVLSRATAIGPFSFAVSVDGRMITVETRAGLSTLDLVTGALELRSPRSGEVAWSPFGPSIFVTRQTDAGQAGSIQRIDVGTPGAPPVEVIGESAAAMSPSWGALGVTLPELPLADVLAPVIAMLPGGPVGGLPPARAASARHPTVVQARAAAALPPRIPTSELAALTAVDPSGVRQVEAALAKEAGRGRCRTVSGRRVVRTRGTCRARGFRTTTAAALTRRLDRLPEGTYRVWLRATDGVGNRASTPALARVAV